MYLRSAHIPACALLGVALHNAGALVFECYNFPRTVVGRSRPTKPDSVLNQGQFLHLQVHRLGFKLACSMMFIHAASICGKPINEEL